MEIQKRVQDLETVFNQRWKANNYKYNGVMQDIEKNKQHFNKMYHIKSRDEQRREILEANSVNGRVERLEQNMKASSFLLNKNHFK